MNRKKERGLQGPAFHCELEGHLFREHFKELKAPVKKYSNIWEVLLDFIAALA